MSIFLSKELNKLEKPAIVKKFYSEHKDEHSLIKAYYANLVTCNKRATGILEASGNNYDSVILDDGLQDYKIHKDLSIVCFNQYQLEGNGLTLPSGPLRERLNSLKRYNIVIINGEKNQIFERKILKINQNLDIFYSKYTINLEEFKNKKIIALAGIGNPNNFFQLLEKNNLVLAEKLDYPDHYNFSRDELEKILNRAKKEDYYVVTTEKDFLRIKHYNFTEIKPIKIFLNIEQKENFLKKVLKVYD